MQSPASQGITDKKRALRTYIRWLYICFLHYSGLLALAKRWVRSNGSVVLTFHRVLSDSAAAQTCSPAGLIMKKRTFEALLKFVSERYSILDLRTGSPAENTDRIPVAITFDDGWEDNASTAFPVASALEVPFTIFICPELMDTPMPFWPEQIIALFRFAGESAENVTKICNALTMCGYPQWTMSVADAKEAVCDLLIKRLKSISAEERQRVLQSLMSCGVLPGEYAKGTIDRTMSWSQVTQLQRGGVTLGSHTQSHEILTKLPSAQAEQEVRNSKAAIEQRVGECSFFSYPNGDASPQVREIVARCGYRQAFINCPGLWRKKGDPLLIPRINLSEGTVTGPDQQFSPFAFQYRVFWNAFVHRKHAEEHSRGFGRTPISSTVEKLNTL